LRIASRPALHLLQTVSPGMRMDELCSRRHLGKTLHVSAGPPAQARLLSKRLADKTVPAPGTVLRSGISREIQQS
jgi:hypothetical protein